MTHWIPLTDYVEMLHGYKSAATIKAWANGSISPSGHPRIEARLVKDDPKRRATWHIDADGERAKALISKANEWKAERDKPTDAEMLADAQLEIESLRDTIDTLNKTIVSRNETIDDMQKTIDTLQNTIDIMEKGKPKRRGKRSSAEQVEADAEMLEQWEAYSEAHEGATVTEFAASIGRPRTTVGSAIRRAKQARA
ncbi:hypothetical protein [Bifidobacterium pseudolongum]|uniref:Uncharacterized protein n=1 Tax=Bifidobacterium pseudolongum subsp. globosum TaxID=1690 RepID=A0A8B3RM30_9BIFI|nr:hypothetical protein [Bifidobacterium pseudolongum]RYQ44120.1 hypothetical protein PG1780B_1606 [Bifidobacterium pseudolongum subsp. globosum]